MNMNSIVIIEIIITAHFKITSLIHNGRCNQLQSLGFCSSLSYLIFQPPCQW
jgi:hypothetical protein